MERALFRQFNKSNLSYTINIEAQLLNAGILIYIPFQIL